VVWKVRPTRLGKCDRCSRKEPPTHLVDASASKIH
jgi:hypothetical protein